MAEDRKVVVNLATGLEDAERVTRHGAREAPM
jgi:hypothetical protein